MVLGVSLPGWHLSALAGKFHEQAVGAKGLLSDRLMAAGQHHWLQGFADYFDAKPCCKIAKILVERAALELLTQPTRVELGHSAMWSSRGYSEVLCWEASAMPKSMQVWRSAQ